MMEAQEAAAFWCQVVNVGLGTLVLVLCAWQSLRAKRVTPHLAMALAIFAISWMEAPFNWAFWYQYNPLLARFPEWGPLGMTSGGLPLMVPFGYVFFFATPVFIAVALTRWLGRKGWVENEAVALLVTGLAVGVVFDIGINVFYGDAAWGRFSRGLAWISINVGTPAAYSLHETLFITPFMMFCTYLMGRRDERNLTLMEAWAEKRATTPAGRNGMTILANVVVLHVLYGLYFIPCFILRYFNLYAEFHNTPLFEGLAPYPAPPPNPDHLWMGVAIMVGLEMLFFVVFVTTVLRKDPLARRGGAGKLAPAN